MGDRTTKEAARTKGESERPGLSASGANRPRGILCHAARALSTSATSGFSVEAQITPSVTRSISKAAATEHRSPRSISLR